MPEIPEVWIKYKSTSDKKLRDVLIIHYSPMVKHIAKAMANNNVDQDDLISYGYFGLMDAIDKFDLSREIKFETYASTRIKGSIIDELRSIDWVPRSIRAKVRSVEKSSSKLENTHFRTPTESEISIDTGLTEEEVKYVLQTKSNIGTVSLDAPHEDSSNEMQQVNLGDYLADKDSTMEPVEAEDMKWLFAETISSLPDREKMVLLLYYYESFTLAQIGEILGVTESRVCQIHTKAVAQLKSGMAESSLV